MYQGHSPQAVGQHRDYSIAMFYESSVLCQIFENNLGPIRAGFKLGVWFSQPLVDGHLARCFSLRLAPVLRPSASFLKIENCARLAVHLN